MRELLQQVFDNYKQDSQNPWGSDNTTYQALSSIKDWLEENIKKDRTDLVIKSKAGAGGWAQVPHFSILNTEETSTTQNGIYIVGLFQHSMEGLYLCIGQGVTGPKEKFGTKDGFDYIRKKSELIKENLAELRDKNFDFENEVELKSTSTRSKDYPKAVSIHYYISKNDIPSNEELKELLFLLLDAYDKIIKLGISSNISLEKNKNDLNDDNFLIMEEENFNNQLNDTFFDAKKFLSIRETLINKKNIIIQGAPGVGKTFIGKKIAQSLSNNILNLVLHENYSYEEFVMGIRPDNQGNFKLTNGLFYNFVKEAINNSSEKYVVVLDEMNRANITKIFGELMVSVEHDKRGAQNSIKLMYSGEDFFLPENLMIIGLMNTADRSLKFIDYALRRRFNFFNFEPEFENSKFRKFLENYVENDVVEKIIRNLSSVNQKISDDTFELGPGYCIGHSYFCQNNETGKKFNNEWYINIINTQIRPLIEEYYVDKPETAESLIEDLFR